MPYSFKDSRIGRMDSPRSLSAYISEQIKNRSIGIEKDIYSVLENL